MTKNTEALEKALDALLKEAAVAANQEFGESLCDPEEDIVFSKEHEKKMQKLFRKDRNKLLMKKVKKVSKIAACILLVLTVGTGVTIFSVEAWRVKFLNFVFEVEQPNTDYNFSETGGTTFNNDEVQLNYLPMGFDLVEDVTTQNAICLTFANGDIYFRIDVEDIDINASTDTENAITEGIRINEMYEAIYITNPNVNTLIWHNYEYSFSISGNITKEEFIKIAENIEILKKK